MKLTGVIKLLFCGRSNLNWKHVNNILSSPPTSFINGHDYAVTPNIHDSIQTVMDFNHCLRIDFLTK